MAIEAKRRVRESPGGSWREAHRTVSPRERPREDQESRRKGDKDGARENTREGPRGTCSKR